MNDRLAAMPLAQARLMRERTELEIERTKLEARKRGVVGMTDVIARGTALRRLLMARLSRLEMAIGERVTAGDDEHAAHLVLSELAQDALNDLAGRAAPADGAESYERSAAAGLRPRRTLSVSEWADAKRYLKTGTANPGPWRTARVPYLREIMDCLSAHSPVQRVVFMKSAQVGGTEAAINWLGYVMEHAPAEMLMVMPSLELMDRFVKRRLNKLIEETDAVGALYRGNSKRDAGNSLGLKVWPGGSLILAGANSPNSLRSDAVRYVICDEVDGFEWEVGQEGDPLLLIDNRMRTYTRRKMLLVSTPTLRGASRIEAEYLKSDRRRYHVPCPHCGERQHLKFAHLKWRTALESEAPGARKVVQQVWYECEACGVSIEEHYKPAMLDGGVWIAEAPQEKTRGYHINALYSPIGMGLRWRELAQKWLDVQGDFAELKGFVNTYLGETWEDPSRKKTEARELAARAEPYRLREVPAGCVLIGVGVDVQDDRIEYQYLGFGRNKRWWVLDKEALPGDPGRDEVWTALAARLNTPLRNEGGRDLWPRAVIIDIGGHHADDVKAFVTGEQVGSRTLMMAGRGSNRRLHAVLPRRPEKKEFSHRGRVFKRGAEVWEIGTEHAKDRLYSDLAGDKDLPVEQRRAHFSQDLDDGYYEQITAEVFDPLTHRYKVKKGKRNEMCDTWVYAFAAMHHPLIRLDKMRDADWESLERQYETPAVGVVGKSGGAGTLPPPTSTAAPAPAARQHSSEGHHGFY